MGEDDQKQSSWWGTVPGILTGIAALVTATAGLLAVIQQFGWFEPKPSAGVAVETVAIAGQTDAGGSGELTPAMADKQSGDANISATVAAKPGMAQLILRNGEKHEVFAESFGYQLAGYDIPLRSGQMVKLALLKQIDVTDISQANDHVGVVLTTRDGSKVTGTVASGSSSFAFVGTNKFGAVNVPLEKIKSVVLSD